MNSDILPLLTRIADSLERLAPAAVRPLDLAAADAFVWQSETSWLEPVPSVSRVHLNLLQGIERNKDILLDNTRRNTRSGRLRDQRFKLHGRHRTAQ